MSAHWSTVISAERLESGAILPFTYALKSAHFSEQRPSRIRFSHFGLTGAPESWHHIRRWDGMGKIFRDAIVRYRTPTDAKHLVAPRNDPRRTEETVVRNLKITNSVTRERR